MTAVLQCTVGGQGVAVPVEAVREVVRASGMVAPLGGVASVIGLLNVRGRVVPVVDWDGTGRAHERIVILEDATGTWLGVGVDTSDGVVSVAEASGGAVATADGASLTLLEPDRLVPVADR